MTITTNRMTDIERAVARNLDGASVLAVAKSDENATEARYYVAWERDTGQRIERGTHAVLYPIDHERCVTNEPQLVWGYYMGDKPRAYVIEAALDRAGVGA